MITPFAKIQSYPYYTKEIQFTYTPNTTIIEDVFLDKLPQTQFHITISDSGTSTHPFSEARLTIATSIGTHIISDSADENGNIFFDSLYISYEPIIQYSKLEIISSDYPFGNRIFSNIYIDTTLTPFQVHLSPADVLLVNADTNNYFSYFQNAIE